MLLSSRVSDSNFSRTMYLRLCLISLHVVKCQMLISEGLEIKKNG